MQNSRINEEIRLHYEALREDAVEAARREKAAVLKAHPDLALLEDEISAKGFDMLRSALVTAEERAVQERQMQALLEKKKTLLTRLGLKEDYAPVHYRCPICLDQGYVDGHACSQCFSMAMAELWSKTEEKDPLGEASFSDFNLERFEDNLLEPTQSPRRRMKTRMENYVADFEASCEDQDRINLFFNGITGTGKTYLATCMARALRSDGKAVMMMSAPQLFRLFSEYRVLSNTFNPNVRRMESLALQIEQVNHCDFLVIDDLGTEALDAHAAGDFISLLNLRQRGRKPMLITSNLDLLQVKARYEERIYSRIAGTFQTYSFIGSDLRLPRAGQ